jgi:clan AA aspartic protease (TIGR02281 family)
MTTGEDKAPPLGVVQPIGMRRRRRGFNYSLIYVGVGVLGLLAVGGFFLYQPIGQVFGVTAPELGTPSLSEARHCWEAGDMACAEADYRAYLAKYPDDLTANATLAIMLTRDGRHKEALPFYRKAMAMGASTYDVYAGYAVSLDATGHIDEAIKMNQAALQIVPQLVDVRGALANELVRKGRDQEAVDLLESFDQQLIERGENPYFTAQIAQIRAKMGAPASAEQTAAAASGPSSSAQAAAPGETIVPLQSDRGTLVVPVLVDNALTLRFVVDSGAADVSIPQDVARTLMRMGKLTGSDYLGNRTYVMANGALVPSRRFIIRSMKVGGREVRDVTASITAEQGTLLLGQSFLRRFKSWSIDNRRRVLVLEN